MRKTRRLLLRLRSGLPNTLLMNGTSALAGLAAGLVLARTLGPQGRGEFVAVVLWPTTLGIVGDLGLTFSLAYHAGRDRSAVDGLWLLAWAVSLGVGGTLALGGICWIPGLLNLSPDARDTLQWTTATVPFILLGGFSSFLLLGTGWLAESNLVRSCATLAYALGVLGVAAAGRASVPNFGCVYALAQVSAAALGVVLCQWRLHTRWNWCPALIRPLLAYGMKVCLSGMIAQVNLRLDQLVMTSFTSPKELGLYAVAVSASSMQAPVYGSLAVVALSETTRKATPTAGGREAQRYAQLVVILGAPMVVGLTLVMPRLLPLMFGEPFRPAVVSAQVLVLAAWFQGAVVTLGNSLRGLGFPGKAVLAETGGLVATLVLLAWWLPLWGALGAALASLVSYALVVLLEARFVVRITCLSWSTWLRPDWALLSPEWVQRYWPFRQWVGPK